jgi:hypothetical protein
MEDPFSISVACVVSGTATFDVATTLDDVAALGGQKALLASTSTLLTFDPSAFAAAYALMAAGRPVADVTTTAGIAAGRTVASFTTNTVTMSGVAAGVLAGDLISFLTWFVPTGLSAQTANVTGALTSPVRGISINQTAGTGGVIATFVQSQLPK